MPKQTTPGRAVEPRVQHSGEAVPAAVRAQIPPYAHRSSPRNTGVSLVRVTRLGPR
jgi:hypothetical protein